MFFESNARIDSLGDYINEILMLQESHVDGENEQYFHWYRGHSDKMWELIPKVQRGFSGDDEELFRKERLYTNDFQARACTIPSISSTPKLDEFASWLTLMQHYGLPTRLLDWSRSPLVALYFAVFNTGEWEKNACVWILTPGKLNRLGKFHKPTQVNGKVYENSYIYNMAHNTITTMIHNAFRYWDLSENTDAVTPEDMKFNHRFTNLADKIAACYPTESDMRVYNQYSAFTVHNSSRKLIDICKDSTLLRVTIPCESKERLLYELSICGITQDYIFPDWEHLARQIQSLHR